MTVKEALGFGRRQFVEVGLRSGRTHWLPVDGGRNEVIVCWGDDRTIRLFNPADLIRGGWHPMQWLLIEVRDGFGGLLYAFRRHQIQSVRRLVLHVPTR